MKEPRPEVLANRLPRRIFGSNRKEAAGVGKFK
jgi:hypothetical protein